jgi:hypothetical protein
MNTLPHFKLYDKILTYPKCGTKYMDKMFNKDTNDNHIDFYELFKSETDYVILRDPLSYFVSAANETLKYEDNFKGNLESLLFGNNVHYNINHYRLLELYLKLNPNKTIILLENLMNFLEHEMKIKPTPFTVDYKTVKIYNIVKIKEEEPYLTNLLLKNLDFEIYSYYNILNDNNVYKPKKSLI